MPASVSTLTNSQFLDSPGSTKNVRTEVTFIALLLLQPIAALSHAGFVLMPDRLRHRRRRFSDRYPQSTSRGRVGEGKGPRTASAKGVRSGLRPSGILRSAASPCPRSSTMQLRRRDKRVSLLLDPAAATSYR